MWEAQEGAGAEPFKVFYVSHSFSEGIWQRANFTVDPDQICSFQNAECVYILGPRPLVPSSFLKTGKGWEMAPKQLQQSLGGNATNTKAGHQLGLLLDTMAVHQSSIEIEVIALGSTGLLNLQLPREENEVSKLILRSAQARKAQLEVLPFEREHLPEYQYHHRLTGDLSNAGKGNTKTTKHILRQDIIMEHKIRPTTFWDRITAPNSVSHDWCFQRWHGERHGLRTVVLAFSAEGRFTRPASILNAPLKAG